MTSQFIIPLVICCLAVWISLGDPLGTPEELPRLLSAIIGVVCGIWFFVVAPWVLQLSFTVMLLLSSNFFLGDGFKVR
ncbi:MAG: hypothetical protein WAN66_13170 [Limnoraphis robusta]|uniref:Uncharacterized protein n=1 Tax=Limnoraphis robusta CS-951 TaxID=1637645 RepID=A0A0F5YBA2_9CYAN|nr:hypothetical protein [Limnoraphis robusta]KKD35510.1 hypothetical protein WN50_24905 [Limnoraphis robusta CS-951]